MLKLLSLGLAGFALTKGAEEEILERNYGLKDAYDVGREHGRDPNKCPAVSPLDMCMKYCGKRVNYSLCRVLCMSEDKCRQYDGCPDCEKIKKTWKLACGINTIWNHDLQLCVGAEIEASTDSSEQEIWEKENWEKVVGARFCEEDRTEWSHEQKKCIAMGNKFCGKGTMWDKKSGTCMVYKNNNKKTRKDEADVKKCGQTMSKVKRGYIATTSRVSTSCECEEFCKTVSKGEFHRAWLFQTVKARNKSGKCSCFAGGNRVTVAPGKDVAGMIEFEY